MHSPLRLLALALLCALPAHAQRYLASGHTDLNVAYGGSGLALFARYNPDAGNTSDEPISNVAFELPDNGAKYAGAGGLLPFLGQAGQAVWLIPQNNPGPAIPWVGFGGYGEAGSNPADGLAGLDPIPELTGSLTAPAVRVRFVGATTPEGADFALWQTGAGGAITLFFSNRPGTTAPQHFGLRSGQHVHFNWGFSQPGYYRVHLRLEGTIGGTLPVSKDVSVVFSVSTLPGFEVWRRGSSRFTAEERALASVGGPDADPDGDGTPNLLEYALQREPRTAEATGHRLQVSLVDGSPALTFERLADPLLVYEVQTSGDLLGAWTTLLRSTGAANATGSVQIAAPALVPPARQSFLRLRVTLPE